MPLGEDDLDWLRLALTPGVGARTAHRLVSHFGGAREVFAAGRSALEAVVESETARALKTTTAEGEAALERTREWLEAGDDRHLLTWADPRYPKALLDLSDPPIVLFTLGRLDRLSVAPTLAIVGSRSATAGGCDDARDFAETLSRAGVVIVSGLALGIDAAAHEGALAAGSSGGGTIAVVGTGLDRVYPARNKPLAQRIAREGLLVSEFPLGTAPLADNFPRRNRLIAALARAVLVVEASMKSGSLITARLAAELGRDVLAMPGSIHSIHHKGCHALIKQGAKLVESAEDVLEELGVSTARLRSSGPAPEARRAETAQTAADPLAEALGYDPVDLDTLVVRTGRSSSELLAELTMLELDGRAEQLPGGLWKRR
ncbi:MAG: DNA-processing protein DprA [Casimicrobiaceae bacterium]|nr:DNA-processing protein DprA [Casimicrobiaceae bacterium]MDW8311237.1 DNA-processing protein DprA [Burkholderiales bacterium]